MPQGGGVKIELRVTNDEGATLAVDGRRMPARQSLSWLDGIGRHHPLVWLRGERMYDVELWLADELVGYVPERGRDVEAAYNTAERMIA